MSKCFTTNLKFFLVFTELLLFVVSENKIPLLQNLATVVRQRQSTLMAKLADFPRLDKNLRES